MTLEQIKGLLAEFGDFDLGAINEETKFQDIGLDSLDVVDLIMKIEEVSGVTVPMDGNLKTVGDILTYIASNK